ncbi:tRNA uridine-5-carboxymethylaminomethyl(34) synthesis GTPase MnmE [Novosphingobium sp. ZN18A2]|uniref:tRNA uridine-5-carboxymethylaminomethyl(34) synthesis GTPase MnmE n=1 Tax=Novosphingobium sp. ZN18A2 TaxID=3079861 RepID=UPI0030D41BA8
MTTTIFALSSGAPPAGVAVVRISGPEAGAALIALCGSLPKSRRATLRTLRKGDGVELDRALVLWMPGPGTATGEDCAELHLHGGRAVVASVESALAALPGLRHAAAGDFTRRAFANGAIDLAEAEGLADLLSAETELQRRSALAMAGGAFSREIARWRDDVLRLSARIEAALDFSDEGEVGEGLPDGFAPACMELAEDLREWLQRPRAEPLREGFRVVLAGPPNAGKSTLFNKLIEKEAAITAAEPGTTRDVLTASVALDGIPFTFVDTAGLREEGAGEIERVGIARAIAAAQEADLVLWLGPEGQGPEGRGTSGGILWEVSAQVDRSDLKPKSPGAHCVSAHTGEGMPRLRSALVDHARKTLPLPGEVALTARQHRFLEDCRVGIEAAARQDDPLLAAEDLRFARAALDRLTGRSGTEDMLDALFGRFCIGK